MEAIEAIEGFSEREWISLSGAYSNEESEIMASLLNGYSFPSEPNAGLSMDFTASYWPANESSSFGNLAKENFSFSDSHPFLLPTAVPLSMDFGMEDVGNAHFSHIQEEHTTKDEDFQTENSKKRSPNPPDAGKTKKSATARGRKRQKIASTSHNEEDQMVSPNGKFTSSFGSEDESNSSSSSSKGCATLKSNGKPRASRGSATDPQSLYARKRRERINERLKTLQGLVPNGTKVDISTMLEEAVQYVKFLQLQIKLLSSDDLWMYAPIAYNGMDIGLLRKPGNIS